MNKSTILYIILGCVICYFLFMNFAYERKISKDGFRLIIINKLTNTCYTKPIKRQWAKPSNVNQKPREEYKQKPGEPFDLDKVMGIE